MQKYTSKQLAEILAQHKLWRDNSETGSPADLSRADLRDADLSGANLRDADLRDADLRDADLSGADLRGADLRDAKLSYARLRDADLNGAKLRYANNIFLFNKPSGRICYAVVHGTALMIKAGCFWDTIDEFEKAAKKRYKDNTEQNYSAQITYLRALELELKP